MSEQNERQGQAKKEYRCDPEQLAMLRRCSEKKDMSEWNQWCEENHDEEIWLKGADLRVLIRKVRNSMVPI